MAEASKPKATEPATPAALTTATTSIRDQPTAAQIAEARAGAKAKKKERINVKTVSGGSMWDPDEGQWIEGTSTRAVSTGWIARQIKAKKLTEAEE